MRQSPVVVDATKIDIFKQITTSPFIISVQSQLLLMPQR